jgi:hypothetical protein
MRSFAAEGRLEMLLEEAGAVDYRDQGRLAVPADHEEEAPGAAG